MQRDIGFQPLLQWLLRVGSDLSRQAASAPKQKLENMASGSQNAGPLDHWVVNQASSGLCHLSFVQVSDHHHD